MSVYVRTNVRVSLCTSVYILVMCTRLLIETCCLKSVLILVSVKCIIDFLPTEACRNSPLKRNNHFNCSLLSNLQKNSTEPKQNYNK